MDRVDALEKVTGRARYAADYRPQGLLVALALRAYSGPGRIRSIDVRRARVLPGVAGIYTHEDAETLGWRSLLEIDALSAEGLGRGALGDTASTLPAYRPLCGTDVYFAGQWIAVAVAGSLEQARAALAHIDVEIDECEPESWPAITPGFFFGGDMQHERGDASVTGQAAQRVRQVYETPMQLHQPMEPSATTAVWEDGGVTLYDSTQGVHATREYVARSLDIPLDRVRVASPYVGGGFGSKNQIWPHQALAAHLARSLGRPVRLQLTRADMAVASGYRSETRQEIELAARADGRLLMLRHVSEVPTSLRGGFFEPCGLNSLMLYSSARVEVAHCVIRRPVATPTPFRAPGETPGSFSLETAMDELAHALRMDPLALRIVNFAEQDSYHRRPWSSNNLLECYRAGAQRFGWPNHYVAPRSMMRGKLRVGYGMATTAYPAPALPAAVRLVLKRGAKLRVETSATDIGTGMRTILAQVVAQTLAIDPARVEVCLGESRFPEAPTAGRSKSTASVLPAAVQACRRLLRQMDLLAPVGGGADLFDRAAASGVSEITAQARSEGQPKDGTYSYYSFGAHFVEIELDEQIGRLRVKRIVSAFDCGHILNHKLAESQLRGGITFGLGMALMEGARRHPARLQVLSDNLAEYAVPVHADIPAIDILFVEHPDTALNELGARGLGEIGVPGMAAAIGNAVYSATGRRCRSLPIPPSLLLSESNR